jgi:hypothetical protein
MQHTANKRRLPSTSYWAINSAGPTLHHSLAVDRFEDDIAVWGRTFFGRGRGRAVNNTTGTQVAGGVLSPCLEGAGAIKPVPT